MKSGKDCCYERAQVNMNEQDVNMNEQDVNVNEQDVNVNGWPGGCCYSDGNLCSLLFLDILSQMLFFGKGS